MRVADLHHEVMRCCCRGFTAFPRSDYVQWKKEGRLINDGVNAKVGLLEMLQCSCADVERRLTRLYQSCNACMCHHSVCNGRTALAESCAGHDCSAKVSC